MTAQEFLQAARGKRQRGRLSWVILRMFFPGQALIFEHLLQKHCFGVVMFPESKISGLDKAQVAKTPRPWKNLMSWPTFSGVQQLTWPQNAGNLYFIRDHTKVILHFVAHMLFATEMLQVRDPNSYVIKAVWTLSDGSQQLCCLQCFLRGPTRPRWRV